MKSGMPIMVYVTSHFFRILSIIPHLLLSYISEAPISQQLTSRKLG